jgi:hypothetical protein
MNEHSCGKYVNSQATKRRTKEMRLVEDKYNVMIEVAFTMMTVLLLELHPHFHVLLYKQQLRLKSCCCEQSVLLAGKHRTRGGSSQRKCCVPVIIFGIAVSTFGENM